MLRNSENQRPFIPASGATPVEKLLPRLRDVRQVGQGKWMAICPSHEDRARSLSVRETPDGRVLLNCFAGCHVGDVLAAVGLELSSLFPERPSRAIDPRGARPQAPRFHAGDLIRLAAFEARVCAVGAADILAGKALSDADRARFGLAVETLEAIAWEVSP